MGEEGWGRAGWGCRVLQVRRAGPQLGGERGRDGSWADHGRDIDEAGRAVCFIWATSADILVSSLTSRFLQGCFETIRDKLKDHSKILQITGIGIGLMQVRQGCGRGRGRGGAGAGQGWGGAGRGKEGRGVMK